MQNLLIPRTRVFFLLLGSTFWNLPALYGATGTAFSTTPAVTTATTSATTSSTTSTTTSATTTIPPPQISAVQPVAPDKSTNLEVTWSFSQSSASAATVRAQCTSSGCNSHVTQIATSGAASHTLTGLKPGRSYNVTVSFNVNGKTYQTLSKSIVMHPNVTSVSVSNKMTDQFTVNLDMSSSHQSTFTLRIDVIEPSGQPSKTITNTVGSSSSLAVPVTGLEPGFLYLVTATTKISGVSSEPVNATQRTELFEPVLDKQLTVKLDSFEVEWMFRGFTHQFQLCTNPGMCRSAGLNDAQRTSVGGPITVSKAITGLAAGTIYTVTVKSDTAGNSKTSAAKKFATKPGQPGEITTDTSVVEKLDAKWGAVNNPGVTGYSAALTCSQGSYTQQPSTASVQFTGLTPGDTCSLQVTTAVLSVTSEARNKLNIVLKPESPTGIKVSGVSARSATVEWQRPASGFQSSYELSYSGTSLHKKGGITGTSLPLTLLPAGTYTVEVRTEVSTARSEPASLTFYTAPAQMQAPTLKNTQHTKELDFEWSTPEDAARIDHYTVWLTRGGGSHLKKTNVSDTSVTSHSFTGLFPGAQYIGYVQSWFKARSSTAVSSAPIATKPLKPVLGVPTSSSTSIRVSWDPPTGSEFTGFEVEVSGTTVSKQMSDRSHDFSLTAGTQYTLSVYTISYSQKSDPAQLTAWTKPNAPSPPVLTSSGTEVTATWSAPSLGQVVSYQVQLANGQSFQNPIKKNVIGNSATFQNLTHGTQYCVRVQSVAGDQVSSFTTGCIRTKPGDVPAPVSRILSETSVRLTWAKPNGTVSGYRITSNIAGSTARNVTQPEIDLTGMYPGRVYTVTVVALSGNQLGSGSTVTVASCSRAVQNLVATAESTNSLRLSWNISNSEYSKFEIVSTSGGTSASTSTSSMTHVFSGLSRPGGTYFYTVYTINSQQKKSCFSRNVTGYTNPRTLSSLTASSTPGTPGDMTVKVTPDPSSTQSKAFLRYLPTIRAGTEQRLTVDVSAGDASVPIAGLLPGEFYNIYALVQSNNQNSSEINTTIQLYPSKPTNLQIVLNDVQSSSIGVQWSYDTSSSIHAGFLVNFQSLTDKIPLVTGDISAGTRNHIVTGLRSGESYQFSVVAFSRGSPRKLSAPSGIRYKTTIPTLDARCTLTRSADTDTDNVVVSISNCHKSSASVKSFHVTLQNKSDNTVVYTKRVLPTSSQVRFNSSEGVIPGEQYLVVVSAEAGTAPADDVLGQKSYQATADTPPVKPSITTPSVTADEVSFTLEVDRGRAKLYEVRCCESSDNTKCQPVQKNSPVLGAKIVFQGLTSNLKYKCTVQYFGDSAKSEILTVEVTTVQTVPGPVGNTKLDQYADQSNPRLVRVSWAEPQATNGVMQNYTIVWYSIESNASDTNHTVIPHNNSTNSYSFDLDLQPGWTWIVHFLPRNNIGIGKNITERITLKVLEPLLRMDPALQPAPTASATENTVVFMLDRDVFSDAFGHVVSYQVLIFVDFAKDYFGNYTWWNASNEGFRDAYAANEPCDLFNVFSSTKCRGISTYSTSRVRRSAAKAVTVAFHVGEEVCLEQNAASPCNGPLPPDTRVRIKIRGFTDLLGNKFTDSLFSDEVYTKPIPKDPPPVGAIVGSVVAVVALTGVGVGLFIFWRRRQGSNKKSNSDIPLMPPKKKVFKPIILSEFENRIVQMKKDDGFEFQAEYEELADVGKHQTREAASLEENRMKNRFINILPYDKSRVKLPTQRDSEPGDDYINANYMCGHNGDKEFICCQGPMPSTADDFWCMIWHQNARAIVMLTKCVENGVQKCHHYWPEDETPMRYGDIEVKVMEVDEKRDWTITKLKVTNVKVAQEKQTRYISHFHYTIWPDFGVPGDYNSLICFVREVRSKLVRKGPPVVVHCSAGVGRTGTFIVLDRCLQHILTHDSVDIFGTVWDMRLMRCFMVQKPVQYVFIHEALLSVIKGDEEDATTNGSAAFNKAFEANEK